MYNVSHCFHGNRRQTSSILHLTSIFFCGSIRNHLKINQSLKQNLLQIQPELRLCKSHIPPCLLLLGFLLTYWAGMHCAGLVKFPTLAPLMCLWFPVLLSFIHWSDSAVFFFFSNVITENKNAENVPNLSVCKSVSIYHLITQYFLGLNGRLQTVEIFVRKNIGECKGTSSTVLGNSIKKINVCHHLDFSILLLHLLTLETNCYCTFAATLTFNNSLKEKNIFINNYMNLVGIFWGCHHPLKSWCFFFCFWQDTFTQNF